MLRVKERNKKRKLARKKLRTYTQANKRRPTRKESKWWIDNIRGKLFKLFQIKDSPRPISPANRHCTSRHKGTPQLIKSTRMTDRSFCPRHFIYMRTDYIVGAPAGIRGEKRPEGGSDHTTNKGKEHLTDQKDRSISLLLYCSDVLPLFPSIYTTGGILAPYKNTHPPIQEEFMFEKTLSPACISRYAPMLSLCHCEEKRETFVFVLFHTISDEIYYIFWTAILSHCSSLCHDTNQFLWKSILFRLIESNANPLNNRTPPP